MSKNINEINDIHIPVPKKEFGKEFKLLVKKIWKNKMLRLILEKAFEFIVVSWIVLTIVYFLINSIPGSSTLTSGLSDQQKAAIEAKYGLNDPLIKRYFTYLGHLVQGDFGISTSFRPNVDINDFLWKRFGISFTVGSIALIITLVIGIPLGIIVGRSPGKFTDITSSIIISIIISIPSVIFALVLLVLGKAMGIPYIYDVHNFVTWILPAVALGLSPSIVYIKYIRTEMNREINSMHAKFAYLKGATRTRFVLRHALKPALYPIITFFPGAVLGTFLGGMFVEGFFQIQGSGGLLISAIQVKDYNIILILVTIYSAITVLAFALRDILYRVLDPRVRV